MNKTLMLTAIAACTLSLAACAPSMQSSDQIQNDKQEELSKQAIESVGLPAIKNFQEKRILKDILELRDKPDLVTYTYITDMNGHLHKICDSIGYGVPYATQYTSPERLAGSWESPSTGNVTVPQADPNGLYSPTSADGTWVLCKMPGKDAVSPTYIEPHVVVSTFPLNQ